jgi:hypothetical protein
MKIFQKSQVFIIFFPKVPHINDVLMNAVNGLEKPELTCISEEGIAGRIQMLRF